MKCGACNVYFFHKSSMALLHDLKKDVIELIKEKHSSALKKTIMSNEINGAAGLASLHASSLLTNLPSSLWLAFLKAQGWVRL